MHATITTKNTRITGAVCTTFLSRARGLMFTPPLHPHHCLILDSITEQHNSLHMLFVFFPIDALWVNNNHVIVDKKTRLAPFTPHIHSPVLSRYVIELPAGSSTPFKI